MDFEEKVVALLEEISQRLNYLEGGQARAETGQTKLEKEIRLLKDAVSKIDVSGGKTTQVAAEKNLAAPETNERYEQRIVKLERAIEKLEFDLALLKGRK